MTSVAAAVFFDMAAAVSRARATSSAASTEPEIALKIALGSVGKETAVHNNWGDSCETRSAQALAVAIAISSAMLLAVSTEPKIVLEIAIGGVGKETAVHNNRGDRYETQSAQALVAVVSRVLHDVIDGVDRTRNHARNHYRQCWQRNSSPQQLGRQLQDTICSGIGGGGIKGIARCHWRCRQSPKLCSKLLSAASAKKQQSTTIGETVARHDLLRHRWR